MGLLIDQMQNNLQRKRVTCYYMYHFTDRLKYCTKINYLIIVCLITPTELHKAHQISYKNNFHATNHCNFL